MAPPTASPRALTLSLLLALPGLLPAAPAPSPDRAARAWDLHHADEDWTARVPELNQIPDPGARRKALRSWIEYRHRTAASLLDAEGLAALLPQLTPDRRSALLLLNLHWLRDDPEAQQALAEWLPPGRAAELEASLAAVGLVPASLPYLPDIQDLEEHFDFWFEQLKPLSQSAVRVFLEGRATARQLAYWMGQLSSKEGELGRRIGAFVMARDPALRGLEADCGFRAEDVQVQARIVFFKYLIGEVREDTFRSWFRMAGDPALTDCLVERMTGE